MIASVFLIESRLPSVSAVFWEHVVRESARGEERLRDHLGQPVKVEREDGSIYASVLIAVPYRLANGCWLCRVQGLARAVDCALVHPARVASDDHAKGEA